MKALARGNVYYFCSKLEYNRSIQEASPVIQFTASEILSLCIWHLPIIKENVISACKCHSYHKRQTPIKRERDENFSAFLFAARVVTLYEILPRINLNSRDGGEASVAFALIVFFGSAASIGQGIVRTLAAGVVYFIDAVSFISLIGLLPLRLLITHCVCVCCVTRSPQADYRNDGPSRLCRNSTSNLYDAQSFEVRLRVALGLVFQAWSRGRATAWHVVGQFIYVTQTPGQA